MKCYNTTKSYEMHKDIKNALEEMRKKRGFSASSYINKKAEVLNEYMRESGLDACVVAVSGGVDSAVVLGIVCKAANMKDSPIKKVCPVLLPCYDNTGVTNQENATSRGKDVCNALRLPAIEINMHNIVSTIQSEVGGHIAHRPDDWATGQLVPYARTPVLYYITSLHSANGYHSIVVGTTNFSEGGYLGYVGKASDGMVDVQLISDIFKSEVYAVARELNLPDSVLNVTPAGDMYDGRVDEEVFGAPYDFVEFYQTFINKSMDERRKILNGFSIDAITQYKEWSDNLEHLHKYNAHKYLCGSPAVHLDLYESTVIGGWRNNAFWSPEEK